MLIKSLDDTTICRGLSKVAFHAVVCPEMNTVCDDGNEIRLMTNSMIIVNVRVEICQ